jgi:hypothetical protein
MNRTLDQVQKMFPDYFAIPLDILNECSIFEAK